MSTESFEALKRRFTRQNREIARSNSTQSLRIRDLESEVSRLLAENLNLREAVVSLEHQVQKREVEGQQQVVDHVEDITRRLNAKMEEFSGLVTELRGVRSESVIYVRKEKRAIRRERDVDQAGLQWEQERRLETIREGGQTTDLRLESSEGRTVISDEPCSTESPDLGPPPIAHLPTEDISGIHMSLPPNLEHRRRRRSTMNLAELRQSQFAAVPTLDGLTTYAGSTADTDTRLMRKLGERALMELDRNEHPRLPVADDFDFTRKPTISVRVDKRKGDAEVGISRVKTMAARLSTAKTTGPYRQALGPKTTNADPVSPVKILAAPDVDKPNNARRSMTRRDVPSTLHDNRKGSAARPRKDTSFTRAAPMRRLVEPAAIPLPTSPLSVSPEPETPHPPLDLMSPPSTSIRSPRRTALRDTPPPTQRDAGAGPAGRAARRQRGPVNYAEPNLRDKMRRPGKVVDAVTGESHRSSLARVDLPSVSQVNGEPDETKNDRREWEDLPSSVGVTGRGEGSPMSARSRSSTAGIPSRRSSAMIFSVGARPDQSKESDQAEGIMPDHPPGAALPPRATVQGHSLLTGVAKDQQPTARIARRVSSRRISALEGTASAKSVGSTLETSEADTGRSNIIHRRHTVARSALDRRRGSSRGDIGSSATVEQDKEVSGTTKECEPEPESSFSSLDLVPSLR